MAHAPEKIDSVFDFLYVDQHRIALFLSQFDQYGHLTSLTKSTSVSNTTTGTLDAKLAKLEEKGDSVSSLSKQFDAQWIAPLSFLDKSNRMLKRGLEDAHIGQIVLVSGALHFFDPMAMKSALDIQGIRKFMLNGLMANDNSPFPNTKRQGNKQHSEMLNLTLEFLKILPHSMQVLLSGKGGGVWCSLNNNYLIGSSSDLMLKHGVKIPGQWNIVGILDAKPESAIENVEASTQDELLGERVMAQFYSALAPLARTMLGRPDATYGMTPLLIFREVMN